MMKHKGKAAQACRKMILKGFVLAILICAALHGIQYLIAGAKSFPSVWVFFATLALAVIFMLYAIFTFYFFRDPDAKVPAGPGLVLAPGHGKVDFIGSGTEKEFMGGECQRISIFLSVIDVHVQNSPASGRVAFLKHTPGRFLSATRADSAEFNENVLIGLESSDPSGEKVGLRLLAGLIARRIIPWLTPGETIARGERISLIQFGSRVDVYLSSRAKIKVKLGDHVVGGETILASFES